MHNMELISLKLIVEIGMEGMFDTCSVMDKMIGQWYECSERSYTDSLKCNSLNIEVIDNTALTWCITSEVPFLSLPILLFTIL